MTRPQSFKKSRAYINARMSRTRRASIAINRAIVRQAKSAPCADCCVSYPYYVMQFDHRRGEKSFMIGKVLSGTISAKRLLAEIAKCDVVCANCHAERTRKDWLSCPRKRSDKSDDEPQLFR